MAKKKKVKIPKSVLGLRMTKKKFAKKNGIKKGHGKKEKKHNLKKLNKEYSEFAINGLNKAVKILAENSAEENKKIEKVKEGVDNIITNNEVMEKIAKIYKKNTKSYENMIFLPDMIMNTLLYYNQEDISDEDKKVRESLDPDSLIKFCEKILSKEIKKYKKMGLSPEIAYNLAVAIPTAKLFKKNNNWYKRFINLLYDIAAEQHVDVDIMIKAVLKIDKKKCINKKTFFYGLFSELIWQKSSNKSAKFNDTQKELHEDLMERALVYFDSLKSSKLKDILKDYIKRRKKAENFKADGKRLIKWTEHATSNSPYLNIKKVVQDLIKDDPSYELYLN